MSRKKIETVDADRAAQMKAYAARIKEGQSADMMTPQESIERIKAGLIGQGFEDILDMLDE